MERKQQKSGSAAGAGSQQQRQAGGGGHDGAPCDGGEPATVVQRTQVVLLAGEPWDADGGQAVLNSLAQHVLTGGGGGGQASRARDKPDGAGAQQQQQQQQGSSGSGSGGQLIFFLCRASSLRERLPRLREVLQGVREQTRASPAAAVVGVIVQPQPDEEAEARRSLEELLRTIFQSEGGAVEVHTAVFAPGRPGGALEIQRVAGGLWKAPQESATWLNKSKLMRIIGAVLSLGTLAAGGYYFYQNPPG